MYKSIFEEVYTERGRQEGRQDGEAKARVEMVKNLLAEGISPDIIERTSGLSQDDIRSLMN